VRPGLVDNGWWPLEAVTDGVYEFELRRWPREADTAICAGVPPRRSVPFVDDFVPGEALAIRSARITVGDVDLEIPVAEDDLYATFRVPLEAGPVRLETVFLDADDITRGAYYVYISLLEAQERA